MRCSSSARFTTWWAELSGFGARRGVVGIEGPAWTIVDAPGDDADARLDSALRSAQLTENFAEIVDASAHLMALGGSLASKGPAARRWGATGAEGASDRCAEGVLAMVVFAWCNPVASDLRENVLVRAAGVPDAARACRVPRPAGLPPSVRPRL
jgi:hypothetical protein